MARSASWRSRLVAVAATGGTARRRLIQQARRTASQFRYQWRLGAPAGPAARGAPSPSTTKGWWRNLVRTLLGYSRRVSAAAVARVARVTRAHRPTMRRAASGQLWPSEGGAGRAV